MTYERDTENRRPVAQEEIDLNPGIACSICNKAFIFGDWVVDLISHNLIGLAARDNPDFVDMAMKCHEEGSTIVFMAHEDCALNGELPS